jgi:hypothetical protein
MHALGTADQTTLPGTVDTGLPGTAGIQERFQDPTTVTVLVAVLGQLSVVLTIPDSPWRESRVAHSRSPVRH